MTNEVPECIQQDSITVELIPPNEWLDQLSDSCPTCGVLIGAGSYWPQSLRENKVQHQLWHYIIASRVLPQDPISDKD